MAAGRQGGRAAGRPETGAPGARRARQESRAALL